MIGRLRVEGIFVIFCGVLVVSVKCENCAYAPICPDISTWKPGFICEDNFTAIIKSRFIDGMRKKTICCRAISKCNEHFWCKPHSSNKSLMQNSTLPIRASCVSGCSPKWKSFDFSNNILHNGIRAGLFSPGISSFIGRTLVNGELQIGRIQISHPTGLYFTSDGSVRFTNSSIEYLEDSNFIWKNSSHGALVENAVTLAAVKNLPFYIGRIQMNGFSYIGTVVRVLGLMYYGDENGIERTIDCYEVLTCWGGGGSDNPDKIDEFEIENAEYIDFNSSSSSLATTTEIFAASTQNSSNSDNQFSIYHPQSHADTFSALTTESSDLIESSSQILIIMNETISEDINNSTGYSYVPPSVPLSSPTSPEEAQSITESTTTEAAITKSPNSFSETFTVPFPQKPSNTVHNASTNPQLTTIIPSADSSLSHCASTKPLTASALISMHLSTQEPSLSSNVTLSSALMSQMSSINSTTEKVSTTITAENNHEVHNVNEGEQIGLQQLISSAVDGEGNGDIIGESVDLLSNGDGSGGDLGMNSSFMISNSNGSGSSGNLGHVVVENEESIDGIEVGINHTHVLTTEVIDNETTTKSSKSTTTATTLNTNLMTNSGANEEPSNVHISTTNSFEDATQPSNSDHIFPNTSPNGSILVTSSTAYNTSNISQELTSVDISSTTTSSEDPSDSITPAATEFSEQSTTKFDDLKQSTTKFTSRPTASKYTPRSTTSRTRFTRRTTTRKTSTVEQNSKPGWLFTTSRTTDSFITDQSIIDRVDMEQNISTEVVKDTEVKEMFECVPHWKQISPTQSFLYDGIEITSQNSNFLSYIGRININNSHILGKIDLKPQNKPTFSFYYNNSNQISTADSINYLSKAQLQNYSWKVSSKGLAVKNAISINQSGYWPYYIGRIKSNGVILIGKVLPSIGLVYVDKYGNEKITKAYEVLTCETVVDEGSGCGVGRRES